VFNLLVGLLFSLSALAQPAFLKEGLVAYYPFNGNANDESGYANHGILFNGASFSDDKFGHQNSALLLNNTKGSFVSVPDSTSLNVTGDLTISAWIRTENIPPDKNAFTVLSKRGGDFNNFPYSFGVAFQKATPNQYNTPFFTTANNGQYQYIYTADTTVPVGQWVHLACVVKGFTVFRYVGDVLVATDNLNPNSRFKNSASLLIGSGGRGDIPAEFFNGAIDDIRIYNRALPDTEVKALYAYESTPPDNSFITNGLVAYYPFNGNANDETPGAAHGKIMSGASLAADYLDSLGNSALIDGVNGLNKGVYIESQPINLGILNYSVNIWFNSNSDKQLQTIFNTSPHAGISVQFNSDKNRRVSMGLGDGGKWLTATRYSANGFAINKWNMATLVKTGDLFTLFVNGKSEATLDCKITGVNQPVSIWLGSYGPISPGALYPGEVFSGMLDNARFYNRALSDGEVRTLYEYESAPQPLNPRIAAATAQVVNGFVVGATITDGGYGYVSNPVITITGGGGTGAKATATQFNGVVTSITITNPGVGYTSAPTITIAPPPFPPRKATSTAQIVNGFVVGTKITDSGFGYDSPPAVLLVGGGGSGATAVATVANGVVTAITITNPGTGYTSAPVVRIASPPFAPKLGIETSKVFVRMSVVLGRKYQLEASTDLNTWTATGPAFIAQDEELVQEFDVNQVGRYFRITQVP
jgi:hypothetical protein